MAVRIPRANFLALVNARTIVASEAQLDHEEVRKLLQVIEALTTAMTDRRMFIARWSSQFAEIIAGNEVGEVDAQRLADLVSAFMLQAVPMAADDTGLAGTW